MSKIIIVSVVLVLFFWAACTGTDTVNPPNEREALLALKQKFKYQDPTDFSNINYTFQEHPGKYNEVDSTDYKWIFKDEKLLYNPYDKYYFYSWHNRDTSFIEFSILTSKESDNGEVLMYYVFDRKGKFIDKFALAAQCGDGGWALSQWATQKGKSKFLLMSRESESDLSDSVYQRSAVDTTAYTITIGPTGKTLKRELYKGHYIDSSLYSID